MTGFITPGPVQAGATLVFAIGLGILLLRHQLVRRAALLPALGSFLTTLAVLAAWATSIRPSDGRAGWRSIWDLFDRSFYDSWPYVFVVGAAATALWTLVDRWRQGEWESTRVVGIAVGSTVAAVVVKLLGG